MAKRCNVCKKTYPDNLRSCPHCEEEIEALEEAPARPGKKGARIELPRGKKSVPADVDDIEEVEEAIEVEEAPPEKGKGAKLPPKKPAQPTKMASAPKPTMLAGDEIDILAEEVVDEAIEVTAEDAPRAKPPAAKPGKPADPKKTQMAGRTAQPTKLAKKSPAPTMLAPADAEADIIDAVVDEAGPASAPKLPRADAPKSGPRQAPDDALDLGTLPAVPLGASSSKYPVGGKKDDDIDAIDLLGGEVMVEGASEINLGEMPSDKGDRPSGLDLIAEAVESGVELKKEAKKTRSADEEAADILADESSAVDLGSSADVNINPFGEEGVLGVSSAKTRPSDKTKPAKEETVAEGEGGEDVVAEAEDDDKPFGQGGGGTATLKAPPKPKYGRRWVGGIFLGLILAAGGVAATSYFTDDIVTVKPLNDALGKEPAKTGPTPEETKLKKQLADAETTSKAQLDAEKKAGKDKADAVEAAKKKEVDDLKKQLKEEQNKGDKSVAELKMDLEKAKADKKKTEESLAATTKLVEGLQASLKEAGFDAATAKDVPDQLKKLVAKKAADDAILEDAAKTLKVEQDKVAAAVKKLDADKKAVDMERARLDGVVKSVRDKLMAGKYLTGDPAKDEVVLAGLDKALKQAISPLVTAMAEVTGALTSASSTLPEVVVRMYDLTKPVEREALLSYFKLREPLVQTPQKMLDTWIPLLKDMDRPDALALAKKASFDANYVKKQDLQATPADKAKADYLLGLAQRNQLNYAEAKKLLSQAAEGAEMPNDPAWKKHARKIVSEMNDPLAYYLRSMQLASYGKQDRMLAELDTGIKAAAPAQKGALLALAGLVRLDKAQAAAKKLDAKMADVAQAEMDGKAAITAGAVEEGNYTLGRRAELLGDLEAALKHYKIAIQVKGRTDLASLYRIALARVLLQVKPAAAQEKKEPKDETEETKADRRRDAKAPARLSRTAFLKQVLAAREKGSLSPAAMLLALNMVFLAVDDDEEEAPKNLANIEEAIKLAREAIELGDDRGYLILGIALTQKNQWTKGLNEYITGLEKLHPGKDTDDLRRMFDEHPIFKLPDSARPPQPLVAEKHYAAGLTYYWDKKYEKAEEEFLEAVKFFDKDARYFYFLGLSQLQQKPSRVGAANESFRLAKIKEGEGNPEPEEVNNALERVQGKYRKIISRLRQKP